MSLIELSFLCCEDETRERLKTKRSGTSWSGGDDSISFSSSFLPAEAFREGIERMTGDSQGKRKNVSNVTCGFAMLLIALSVVNYLPSLLWEPYLCCPSGLGLLFSPFCICRIRRMRNSDNCFTHKSKGKIRHNIITQIRKSSIKIKMYHKFFQVFRR